MVLMGRPQIIVSNLEDIFPVTISEFVLKFSGIPCTFNICVVWCDPKERIQAIQSMSLMKLFMWATCTSICTVRINFVFLGKYDRPCMDHQKALFGEIWPSDFHTIRPSWHYTIFFLSLKPHDILNYKFSTWKIHYSSYDLFITL